MSRALYVGFDRALDKVEYGRKEIFTNFEYPNSLYAQDGILFDEASDEDVKCRIGNSFAKYVWYEVKAIILPFEAESRLKSVMPDYYLAAYRITEWFIKYLEEESKGGNHPHLLQRWLGDKQLKKAERRTLKTENLRREDYALPYDVLLNIR